MRPKNSPNKQDRHFSFIEQARRKQIIDATIQVLAERGFIKTSFVRIAEKAGINTSLISYHFNDKAELTDQVRQTIYKERFEHVETAVFEVQNPQVQLQTYLESDIAFMTEHPKFFRALVEVLFGQRDKSGMPEYMKDMDTPMFTLLFEILKSGQKAGDFGAFDARALAHVIDGAKDQFLAQMSFRPSLNVHNLTKTLTSVALQSVQKENA